jgi:hypothetical protein
MKTTTTYSVFVKFQWMNGFDEIQIDERRLWLDGFVKKANAEAMAEQARQDPRVLAAWVEKIERENGEMKR